MTSVSVVQKYVWRQNPCEKTFLNEVAKSSSFGTSNASYSCTSPIVHSKRMYFDVFCSCSSSCHLPPNSFHLPPASFHFSHISLCHVDGLNLSLYFHQPPNLQYILGLLLLPSFVSEISLPGPDSFPFSFWGLPAFFSLFLFHQR